MVNQLGLSHVGGVRKGNLLSPLLFVLSVEVFDSMMRTILNNWIRGFQIGGAIVQTKEICHLLYADDTFFFVNLLRNR